MLVPFFRGEEGVLGESVENTASPPTPLRMERGVVCEVTPISLVLGGEGLLNIRRTYRGYLGNHSPLHSERGWGVRLLLVVTFCEIG